MLLPAIQHGDWKTVKAMMRKVVSQLRQGANLVELMTADGMLDTADLLREANLLAESG